MKGSSFKDKNVGCNITFNNKSDRLKSYSISWAYLVLFYATRDWLKNYPWCVILIEKSSAMCDWNPLLCHPLGSFMICYEWRDVTCKIWPLNLEFMAQVVSLTCLFLVVSFRCKLPLKKGQITVLRCGNNASLLRMLMTYSAKWINSSGRMRKKSYTSKVVNSVGITVVNFK